MKKYIIKQTLLGLLKLLVVLLIVFLLVKMMKVDVVDAKATAEVKASIRHELGLDLPVYKQFLNFLGGAVTLNFGESWKLQQGVGVIAVISEKISYSAILAFSSFGISLLVGFSLGKFTAKYVGTWKDSTATLFVLFLHSVPAFVVAVFIQYGGTLIGLPSIYEDGNLLSWFLPVMSLSLILSSTFTKNFRFYLVDVYTQEYITTARAKGLTEKEVLAKHAQRNALIPMVAPVITSLFALITGTISIERLFNIPGIGSLVIDATNAADQPVILGMVFIITTFTIIATTLINVLYAVIDPRVRV